MNEVTETAESAADRRTRIGTWVFGGVLAVVVLAVGAGSWWNHHQEQQRHEQRVTDLTNAILCDQSYSALGFSSAEACRLSMD